MEIKDLQPQYTRASVLNKVPQITLYFWIIKILCTTVGETAADYLNENLKLGLTNTSIVMFIFLALTLFFQFKSNKYVPGIYWLAVVMISVVGTLITDNLTDNMGVSLQITTGVFFVSLLITFAVWYAIEHTLSVHSIVTVRREAFYWLAILFTFALGTAAGDLVAESLNVGYLPSAAIFAICILVVYLAYKFIHLNAVIAFWAAYILTRPLGASLGDYFSQSRTDGGLGLGAEITSAIFLVAILCTVIYLARSKKDVFEPDATS